MSEHRLDRIVIERPRSGMRISSQRKIRRHVKQTLQQTKYDYQAAEIGTLKPCYKEAVRGIRSKWFSDHLSPLYKWLHSKVGQPWNDVYGELSQLLEFNTLSGQHILVHVWQFVTRHVVMIDDIPHSTEDGYRNSTRLSQDWRGRAELYVHPSTGILCAAPPEPKKSSTKQMRDYLYVDAYHQYYKLNEIWYLVSFRQVPEPFKTLKGNIQPTKVRDVLQRKTVTYSKFTTPKNIPLYAYHKRQCNKKEIKWIKQQIELKATK